MGKLKRRHVSADEQDILDHLQVRLLTSPKDRARCDELILQHHYLHDATLVGEHLRYVAPYKGQWLALATWSGAAFHLKDRDAFIGWDFQPCRRRRGLLANNSRLLVLPECHSPNLIWVRELVKRACVQLRAAQLPPEWAMVEAGATLHCTSTVKEIGSLMQSLRQELPEFRRPQALGYPLAGMICLIVTRS